VLELNNGTHLSNEILVESKSHVGRVTPVDDGDTGPVSCHVQPFYDPLDKVKYVVPSLYMHRAGRIEHEHKVHLTGASCVTVTVHDYDQSQQCQRTTTQQVYTPVSQVTTGLPQTTEGLLYAVCMVQECIKRNVYKHFSCAAYREQTYKHHSVSSDRVSSLQLCLWDSLHSSSFSLHQLLVVSFRNAFGNCVLVVEKSQ